MNKLLWELFLKVSDMEPLIRILNVTANEVQYEGGETYAQEKNRYGDDGPYVGRRIM